MRTYLDASAVILRFEGTEKVREGLKGRFRSAHDTGGLVASELTRLECRVGPLRRDERALLDVYNGFFSGREITVAALDRPVCDLAAEVRARHGLKTPDALHVACAVTTGCDVLLTADARLARCGEIATELVAV